MSEMRVQAEGLVIRYGAFTALQPLTLGIEPGQYVIVLGENGAGKSSLLKCLGGWIRPTEGAVWIDGLSFEDHERTLRSRIKVVPDTPAFYPELTAWEHAELVVRAHRRAKDPTWREEAMTWFHAFGIDANRSAYPSSFSRGMQYKLAIIMSILTKPQCLFLDEPFGPLDPASQTFLASQLTDLKSSGVSIVVSTHLLPNAHPPDRVLLLDQGDLALDEALARVWPGDDETPLALLPDRLLQQILAERRDHVHE